MAQVVYKVRRIRAAIEPNGAHGTELSIGNFVDIQAREDSYKVTLDRPMESPLLLQQHLDGYPSKVFLPRKAGVEFSTNLRALPSRAASGITITAATVPDAPLWGAGLGGEFLGTGTTIASTSTVTALNVSSAAGLREGGALACATGPGGALEVREIKTIATNVVTLKLALSGIPATSSIVYAAATYYLDATDGGLVRSIQMAIEGQTAADRWLLKGGQLAAAPKLSLAPGTVPKVDWSTKHTEWVLANGTNTAGFTALMNLAATPISDQSYADTGINAVMDSEFRIMQHGVSTLSGTLIDAQQINITPQLKYGPHTTPAGQNTVKQWVRLRNDGPACVGDFALPYEDTTWRDKRDAETDFALFYQIGSSVANGAVLVSVPRVSFDDWKLEEVDEISGQRIPFYAKLDNQTTANSSNLQKSAFRFHCV